MSNTLKFSNIAIGTLIRAYDFEPIPGRRESYIEGFVVADYSDTYGQQLYGLDVTVDSEEHTMDNGEVWTRRSDAHSDFISTNVPHETMFDYDGRIQILETSWA